MRTLFRRGWQALKRLRSDLGANLMETALAVLLISVVALADVSYFGRNTSALWDEVPASFEVGNGGSSGGGSGGDTGGGDGGGDGGEIDVCTPAPCPTLP